MEVFLYAIPCALNSLYAIFWHNNFIKCFLNVPLYLLVCLFFGVCQFLFSNKNHFIHTQYYIQKLLLDFRF